MNIEKRKCVDPENIHTLPFSFTPPHPSGNSSLASYFSSKGLAFKNPPPWNFQWPSEGGGGWRSMETFWNHTIYIHCSPQDPIETFRSELLYFNGSYNSLRHFTVSCITSSTLTEFPLMRYTPKWALNHLSPLSHSASCASWATNSAGIQRHLPTCMPCISHPMGRGSLVDNLPEVHSGTTGWQKWHTVDGTDSPNGLWQNCLEKSCGRLLYRSWKVMMMMMR